MQPLLELSRTKSEFILTKTFSFLSDTDLKSAKCACKVFYECYQDFKLKDFLEKKFKVILNTTGTDDVLNAVNIAKLVVVGEKHLVSFQKRHNILIEKIYKPKSVVVIEDSAQQSFDPREQLPFVNHDKAPSITVKGWEHPEIVKAEKKIEEMFISACLALDAEEEKFFDDIIDLSMTCLMADMSEKSRLIEKIKREIEVYHLTDKECYEKIVSIFNFLVIQFRINTCTNEKDWKLRTDSLITTVLKYVSEYEQVILIGGGLHFDCKPNFPFAPFVIAFHNAIKDIPTLMLRPLIENETSIEHEIHVKIKDINLKAYLRNCENRCIMLNQISEQIREYEFFERKDQQIKKPK